MMKLIEKLMCQSKTGRFICHIGPPKTGTTALQFALQNTKLGAVRYLGTFQPREGNTQIYSALMKVVATNATRYIIYRNKVKLYQALKAGTDLIISEEMLLVNQGNTGFEQKLRRLRQVTKNHSCVIVISLREPVAALKSFYSEIYFRQGTLPRISFEEFLASDQARVYDYAYLLEVLQKCGFGNVRCVSIQRGQTEINLSDFTGFPEHRQLLPLEEKNQTEASFREQVASLEVPEGLTAQLRLGYEQAIALAQQHEENIYTKQI